MSRRRRRPAPTLLEIALQLALEEQLAERDVRPGPVRCDVDRSRRLRALERRRA